MVANAIEKKLGKLARTTGTKHTFLGMDIEFIGDKKVAIGTPQHILEAIEDFGEDLDEDAVNPANLVGFYGRNIFFTVVIRNLRSPRRNIWLRTVISLSACLKT